MNKQPIERHADEIRDELVRADLADAVVVPEASEEPQAEPRPNFARGQERDPRRRSRFILNRFSRGQETEVTHEDVHEGTFATGQRDREQHLEGTLKGRFARR
jgi:hypothetical protein